MLIPCIKLLGGSGAAPGAVKQIYISAENGMSIHSKQAQ